MDNSYIRKSMMNAEGYLEAANALRKKISNNGYYLGIYGPAYTANLAFACELYIKQLLLLTGRHMTGHKLENLYNELPEQYKQEIDISYRDLCTKCIVKNKYKLQLRSLKDCIHAYNNAFEDWRYWYEGGKQSISLGWIDFHILIEVIKSKVEEFDLSD